ncbi:hypothetical protein [Acidiphilium sp.]|uniref:hypothetical protein n=1 Tax=Acidiphilium sp. TaxID=527 RepID=UPI003D01AC0B
MKALVIGLGILIVLGTALVIGVVVKRMVKSTESSSVVVNSRDTTLSGVVPFSTILPAETGGKIAGIAASGGVIAIWLRDGKGGRVAFIDPHTGALLGTAAEP